MHQSKPVKCVVVPARPPIDKLIAFKRVELDLKDTFRVSVAFCNVNFPSIEDHARWDGMCTTGTGQAYLIDVGEKKYHKNAESAAGVEKMSSETHCGRTWNRLLELVNDNNRTGKLKKARHSVAKILRDAYEVMDLGFLSQSLVFDHGMAVVNAFFFHQNKRGWSDLFSDSRYEGLRELWDGFSVSEKEVLPFTLPQYFRHLFLSGRGEAEIKQKIGWWLDKVERIEKAKEAAKAKKYTTDRSFIARFDNKRTGVIYVGNIFEANAAIYQLIASGDLAVGIIRNERGQVHIQSSIRHPGANFDILAEGLEALEPGRWYHEKRFAAGPMLMNGSRQFIGVTPTSLSDDDLIRLVRTQVTFDKK